MRALLTGAALALLFAGSALAQGAHWVNGYYRSNGTYVQGHMQTNPDGNPYNNWSTEGNVNPYTGQPGTRQPYPTVPNYMPPETPNYYQPPPAPVYGGGGINPYVNNRAPQRTCGPYSCF